MNMKPRIKKFNGYWVCGNPSGWMGGWDPVDAYYRWARVFK